MALKEYRINRLMYILAMPITEAVAECGCGRVHYKATDSQSGNDYIYGLKMLSKSHPDKYIPYHRECIFICNGAGLGRRVANCPCQWEENFYNYLMNNELEIKEFYNSRRH